MKFVALLISAISVISCGKAGHESRISSALPEPEVPTANSVNSNPNIKPDGWKIPLSGELVSRKLVELNSPNGKERVELTRRYFPNDTKISIPNSSGQAEYLVRVKNVDEFARKGQSPYAYQLIVAEVCERPQDCRPVSWIINFRDEDGDKIFETYGGTILPPAWAK